MACGRTSAASCSSAAERVSDPARRRLLGLLRADASERVPATGDTGFADFIPLVPAARVVLLVAAVVGCIATLVSGASSGFPLTAALQFGVTAAFALFAVNPIAAAAAIAAAMCLSFPLDIERPMLLAVIVAVGFVSRIGSRTLLLAYGGFVVVAIAGIVWMDGSSIPAMSVLLYVVFAVIAGSLGLLMRAGATREQRLAVQLIAEERRSTDIVRDERARIAADLHDVIARDLVVIVMHARALDQLDRPALTQAQAEILSAAKSALSDIRVIVAAVDPVPLTSGVEAPALAEEIAQAHHLLDAPGRTLRVGGAIPELPKHIDGALGRILREAVLNASKHGAPGETTLEVQSSDGEVRLELRNPIHPEGTDVPFALGGHGITRMREHAQMLGGDVETSCDHDVWTTSARLPL